MQRDKKRDYGALRQRAITMARNGLAVGEFAARLSRVLQFEVPAHVIHRLEAGHPVDWGEFDYDVLDLYLAISELVGQSLSELFQDPDWLSLVRDVEHLEEMYG